MQSPPDKPGIRRSYPTGERYLLTMSLGDDSEREQLFMDWISGVIREFKAKGWSRERVAEAGDISRNQLYQWEGRGKKGFNMPKPASVKAFCEGLGIPWEVPFRILGWDTASGRRTQPAPDPDPVPDLSSRIRLLRLAIERPGIGREEQRELEIQLARLQAAQRMNEDAIAAADEALKRHKAG